LTGGPGAATITAVPIYDYSCVACEERFDELLRFDDPAPPCPSCGSAETNRLLSTFLVPNSAAGQRRFQVDAGSALHAQGCCGGGGCGTHAG
jgi:putative FmdB family regulatory protein